MLSRASPNLGVSREGFMSLTQRISDRRRLRPRRRECHRALAVQRRWHMVAFAQALQSLELIHGLEELTVDRRLIAHEWKKSATSEKRSLWLTLLLRATQQRRVASILGRFSQLAVPPRFRQLQIGSQACQQTVEMPLVLP